MSIDTARCDVSRLHNFCATWVTQWAVVPHIPPPRACSHHQSISQPRKYARTAKQINLSWLYDKGNHLRSFENAKTTWWRKRTIEDRLRNLVYETSKEHQLTEANNSPCWPYNFGTRPSYSLELPEESSSSFPTCSQCWSASPPITWTQWDRKAPRYAVMTFKCVPFLSCLTLDMRRMSESVFLFRLVRRWLQSAQDFRYGNYVGARRCVLNFRPMIGSFTAVQDA